MPKQSQITCAVICAARRCPAAVQILFQYRTEGLVVGHLKSFDIRIAQDRDPERPGRLGRRAVPVAKAVAIDLNPGGALLPPPTSKPRLEPRAAEGVRRIGQRIADAKQSETNLCCDQSRCQARKQQSQPFRSRFRSAGPHRRRASRRFVPLPFWFRYVRHSSAFLPRPPMLTEALIMGSPWASGDGRSGCRCRRSPGSGPNRRRGGRRE